ncbi:hypothetical protein LXL04_020950 [Taraxacum kok-saghyz]
MTSRSTLGRFRQYHWSGGVTKTIFRQVAYRLLTRSTNTYTAGAAATLRRPCATEVSADTAPGDSAFSEAWKKVAPTIDPPKILIQFMEPRPPTPSSLPAKLTVNFVLPYSSELSKKEVDMVIVPATTGQMGILPGHVPMSFVSLFRFRLISNLLITDLFRAAAVSRAFIPGVATTSKSVTYSEISVALDLRQQDLRQHLLHFVVVSLVVYTHGVTPLVPMYDFAR